MKRCTLCKCDKPVDAFNKKRASKDGLQSACRECSHARFKVYYANNKDSHIRRVNENSKDRRAKLRKALVDYLKTHPCVDCGETDIRVLEFDHLPEFEKVKEVTRLIAGAYSEKVIWDEVAKCEVRCKNHHAIKTYERMGNTWHNEYLLIE